MATDLIQIKIKKTDYARLVKYGVAGEPVHEAASHLLAEHDATKAENVNLRDALSRCMMPIQECWTKQK